MGVDSFDDRSKGSFTNFFQVNISLIHIGIQSLLMIHFFP